MYFFFPFFQWLSKLSIFIIYHFFKLYFNYGEDKCGKNLISIAIKTEFLNLKNFEKLKANNRFLILYTIMELTDHVGYPHFNFHFLYMKIMHFSFIDSW